MNSYYATIGEKLNNLLPPPVTTTPALLDLFRYSIDSGTLLSDWKIARLTPVHKKDDESYPANYRPISLLSIPSKLLESEANDNIASDRQWAYRPGFSTELLLIHLTEIWRRLVDEGNVVALAFIDFKKAFDSVNHEILLSKS